MERMTVMTINTAPAARESSAFSEESIKGDDGFGRDIRMPESAALLIPVFRPKPAVGSGGGTATIEVDRANKPRIVPCLLDDDAILRSAASKRIAPVAFRVRAVRLRLSHMPCFPGFCSSAPSPAATATSNTKDVAAPPKCIAA